MMMTMIAIVPTDAPMEIPTMAPVESLEVEAEGVEFVGESKSTEY